MAEPIDWQFAKFSRSGHKRKNMNIKILGRGCASCKKLYGNTKKAVTEMNISADVEYITDMEKVMAYSVMSMPALVVNEQVVAMGKVLKPAKIVKILEKVSG